MSSYRILESSLIVMAMLVSAGYALVHLAPAMVASWRRTALLWLIAERRPALLRKWGRGLARRQKDAVAAGRCGPCKGCAPSK